MSCPDPRPHGHAAQRLPNGLARTAAPEDLPHSPAGRRRRRRRSASGFAPVPTSAPREPRPDLRRLTRTAPPAGLGYAPFKSRRRRRPTPEQAAAALEQWQARTRAVPPPTMQGLRGNRFSPTLQPPPRS